VIKSENRAVGHVFGSCPKLQLILLFFFKLTKMFSECSVRSTCLACITFQRDKHLEWVVTCCA